MKKILSKALLVLTAVTGVVSLASCTSGQKPNSQTSTTPTTTTPPTTTTQTPTTTVKPTTPTPSVNASDILKNLIIEADKTEISADLALPSEMGDGENTYPLTWTSNNNSVVIGDIVNGYYSAKVTKPESERQTVTLTATLTVAEGNVATREFTVYVNPYLVTDFVGDFVFEQNGLKVFEDFELPQSHTIEGTDKSATITWESTNEDYIVIDGTKAKVTPSAADVVVTLKATVSYGGETATLRFRVIVSKPTNPMDDIYYWYNNTNVTIKMSGYVTAIATAYDAGYGNVSLYMIDDTGQAGFYLYRVKMTAAEAAQLQVGAHVTCTGTTNTSYNGLMETNAGGELVVDEDIAPIDITPYAIDDDLTANAQSLYFRTSQLVSLTNWKVKSVSDATGFTAQSTTKILTLEKNGVETTVCYSKYVASTPQSGEVADAVIAKLGTIKVGDYVSVSGILSYYNVDKAGYDQKSYQIYIQGVDSIQAGTEDTATLRGTVVAPALVANANLFAAMYNSDTTVELPQANGDVQISWALADSYGQSAKVDGTNLVITPIAKPETITIIGTYSYDGYSTQVRYVFDTIAKTSEEKVAAELDAFKLEAEYKAGEYELPTAGSTYKDVAVTYEVKSGEATVAGNVITFNKVYSGDTEVVVTVTFKCGDVTQTKDITVKLLQSENQAVYNKVTSIAADTNYKMGLVNTSVGTDVYYFTGAMDSHYGATSTDSTVAVDVKFVAVEGGYNLMFVDAEGATKYINFVLNGTYKNFMIEDTASSVWVWNSDLNTVTAKISDVDYVMGTRNDKTYTTISPCTADSNAFVVEFYQELVPHKISRPAVGEAYKFGVYQGNLDKTLFFTGGVSSTGFGETTEVEAEAMEFYLEETTGGYYFYFVDGEAKNYVNIVDLSGKVRHGVSTTPSTVWTWNTEYNTLVSVFNDTEYYMGTYDTFATYSMSKLSYAATSFVGYLWGYVDAPEATLTDEDKANEELNAIKFDSKLDSGEYDLVTTPKTYENAVITYALKDTDAAAIEKNMLILNTVYEATTVTLTVTVELGDAVVSKDIEIAIIPTDTKVYKVSTTLAENVAYKLGLVNTGVGEDVYYFDGTMNGFYGNTQANSLAGVDVKAKAVENGYNLYFADVEGTTKYINVSVSGTYVNFVFADTATTVWTFDSTLNTVVADVDGTAYAIGTSNSKTYTTLGMVKTTSASFFAQLYVEAKREAITYPLVNEPYKMGLINTKVSATDVYYFDGTMNGFYGNTQTGEANGVDFYFVAVKDGWNISFTDSTGTTQYVNLSVSGTYRNFVYSTTPSTVWTWDTDYNTLVTDVEGTAYAIGTSNSKTYTTLGCVDPTYSFVVSFYGYNSGVAPEKTDEEKANEELAKIQLEDLNSEGSYDLIVVGQKYTDAVISYNVSPNTPAASVVDGKLVASAVTEDAEVIVTVFVTLGEVEVAKEIIIKVLAPMAANQVELAYTFSSITNSTQYATETHKLSDDVSMTIESCHVNTQLRIYSSTTNNGKATFTVNGVVNKISFNAGNKVDTLNVYGSTDGQNWTLVQAVSITATSYNEYEVDFGSTQYTYFYLDVAGSSQVRLQDITIVYTKTE